MSPFLPYLAIPLTLSSAWFAGTQWTPGDPGRYRVPSVEQLEDPGHSLRWTSASSEGMPYIRVAAFLPPVPQKPRPPEPTLILHSVMTGAEVGLATINNQVVRQGDTVQGYRVSRISPEGVELVRGQETRQLMMRPIHQLPPPTEPGVDPDRSRGPVDKDREAARDFWATFNSPKT